MIEHLTAEQVLFLVEETCKGTGNSAAALAITNYFAQTGEIAPAAMAMLNLKRVTMYQRER